VPAPAPRATRPRRPKAGAVKVAIIGRPNVGKSTLVNTLLGEERVVAFDEPGRPATRCISTERAGGATR
jgi:GTP-binding protein